MDNDWTKEIDRLRAENKALAAELAMAQERLRVVDAWIMAQIDRIKKKGVNNG